MHLYMKNTADILWIEIQMKNMLSHQFGAYESGSIFRYYSALPRLCIE